MALITALDSFPNYEDYKTSGKLAYANAVRTWLSSLLTFQTQTNALRDEVVSSADQVSQDKQAAANSATAAAQSAETATNKAQEAIDASAILTEGAIDDTNIALNKAYSNQKVDGLLGNKADKATTLIGYGIIDAYTKDEANALLDNKVDLIASTDNAIPKFDSTTGQLQNTAVTIDDSNRLNISSTIPTVYLNETDGTSTHNTSSISQSSDAFNIQARDNNKALLANAYKIAFDASGVTYHSFFAGASNEKIRLTDSFFMFNTTDPTGISNGASVNNASYLTQGTFASQRNDSANIYLSKAAGYSSGTFQVYYVNGVSVGSITTTGSATAFNTSSDYRLKEDYQDITNASAKVLLLNPINFKWKASGDRVDGFVAHELAEVIPEAVTGEKDATEVQAYIETPAKGEIYIPATEESYKLITPAVIEEPAYYDIDGKLLKEAVEAKDAVYEVVPAVDEQILSSDIEKPETLEKGQKWRETTAAVESTRTVEVYQGIDQSKIVPLLTKALQEALTKITDLESRVNTLEGN